MSIKTIDTSKILITGKNRIRINGVGIFDMFYPNDKSLIHYQQEDIWNLGRVILSLACKSHLAIKNISKSLEFTSFNYSPDLDNFLKYTLGLAPGNGFQKIDDVCSLINTRIMREIDYLH